MGKAFNQAVRACFARSIAERLPRFEPWRGKSPTLFSGERVWRWVPLEPLHCFVLLVTSPKGYNEFTVELGWSRLARFPELSMRPSPERPGRGEAEREREEYICRLPELAWGEDRWWRVGEERASPVEADAAAEGARPEAIAADLLAQAISQTRALSADEARRVAAPLVAEAIAQLATVGVPYLERFVATFRR